MGIIFDPQDELRFGYRLVCQVGADGKESWTQLPLRQEDLLHPREEDFITNGVAHGDYCHYLYGVLTWRLMDLPDTYFVKGPRIDWGVPGVEPHGPDFTVFAGDKHGWNRQAVTFKADEVGARPLLVIEVTSPSTRALDLDEKVLEYHRAGIPWYAVVDLNTDLDPPRVLVLAYRSTPEGYVRVPPDARGWVWLEPVRVWMAGEDEKVVCFTERGNRYPTYEEAAEALDRLRRGPQ